MSQDPPVPPTSKILEQRELLARFARPREGRLVFTNGCFDLLHPGHVACLDAARRLGDLLVVGVNSDASFRRQGKGSDRPLVPEADRCAVLAGLDAVDVVVLFDEDTPRRLIADLRPDILVKGGDYTLDEVVGRTTVLADGGLVRTIPLLEGYSTTELVNRIRTSTPSDTETP